MKSMSAAWEVAAACTANQSGHRQPSRASPGLCPRLRRGYGRVARVDLDASRRSQASSSSSRNRPWASIVRAQRGTLHRASRF